MGLEYDSYEGMRAFRGVAAGSGARPWLAETTFDMWKMIQSITGVGIDAAQDRRNDREDGPGF